MAKYKITGVPSLEKKAKGGNPGDKYYKNSGNQYKKNSAGQWFVYDPAYKSWNYVNQGIYNGIDLEANKSGFTADDASWTTPKAKSKTSVSSYEEQRNKAVNNPLLSTEEKIKATSGPLSSNVNINANLIEQKKQEDLFQAQAEQRKLIEEAQRKEDEAFKQMNPEFYYSETIPTVARNSGALLTDLEKERAQEIQNSKNQQRVYIANDYVKSNRDVLINESTNNAKAKFSNLSWDEAKELSSIGVPNSLDQGLSNLNLEIQIKEKFPNATAQQIKQYSDFIFQTREKSKEKAFKYSDNVDTKSALKSAGYYDHWSPDEIKAPGPGKHIELSGRMPQTAGEWGTRLLDIAANPLDAIHYGMSSKEEMPMNMYDYEKAKQMTGYEDGADKNLLLGAIDFASWMTPVGALGQGAKMLRPTGESVGTFIDDPNLATAGNAALNLGFNALAFSGLRKIPGANTQSLIANPTSKYAAYAKFPGNREVVYGNQFLQEAKTIVDLPGFKLAKGNVAASTVPAVPMNAFDYFAALGTSAGKGPIAMAALQEGKGLLPAISDSYNVTKSPLTIGTQIPEFTRSPLTENPTVAKAVDDNISMQKLSGTDDETVSTIFNDIRARKIDLWQTAEGEKRLQKMIDNTPSLEGQTPQSMVEKMVQLENINTTKLQHTNRITNIETELNQLDQQFVNKNISEDAYVARTMQLDDELQSLQQNLDLINQNTTAAFYNGNNNAVGINANLWKEGDIGKVTSHELGHFLGATSDGVGTTYLDDMLGDLDLIKNTSKQLTIQGLEGTEETIGAHNLFGHAKDDYLNTSLKYFKEGSGGTEKVPFVSEAKQDMLEKGIIKNEYDTVTPKMIKDHFKDYQKTRGEKYPLRIYDIMKDKPDNFSLIAKTMNYLPYITIGAATIDQMTKDEDSDALEAGVTPIAGLIAVLSVFSKKPSFKLPKKVIKLGSTLLKEGYSALTFKDKKYLKDWIKLDELVKEKGMFNWDVNHPVNINLQQAQRKQSTAVFKAREYFENKRLRPDTKETNEDLDVTKRAMLTSEHKNKVQGFELGLEGVQQVVPSLYQGTTTTGSKEITDFTTGNKVKAYVSLPAKKREYKKEDGQLVIQDTESNDLQITPEYSQTLKNNINKVQTEIPGAKVFGSSVLVSEAGMPHLTEDLDLLITEGDYNKNVVGKYNHMGPNGPAEMHAVYPEYGDEGILDFNIIHEDADGFVKPTKSFFASDKTPTEIELFRQFYPEQFQEAAKTAIINDEPIKINMKANEFLAGIDPKIKTIIDAYESTPYSKWGGYNPNKEKHINRPDILITYGEPSVVAKGQEMYIKSVVGPKGNLGHQFTKAELSDVDQNINTLLAMKYPGDILTIASNPDRMQLVLNDFYINNTTFSREIDIPYNEKPTEQFVTKALTNWYPGNAGSYMGTGLNTVSLGNPTHVSQSAKPIIGHRQLGLDLNTNTPLTYINSINRATSGNYAFTPEEIKEIQDIFKKHISGYETFIDEIKNSKDILAIGNDFGNIVKSKEALEEIAAKTKIRAIRRDEDFSGEYGSSIYASLLDTFDEAVDAMMYSLKDIHVAPKSMKLRNKTLEQKKQSLTTNLPKKTIDTIQDYDKISNLLEKGVATADLRLKQLIQYRDNILNNENALIDKFLAPVNKQVEAATEASNALQKEIETLIEKRTELTDKIHKIRTNREKLLQYVIIGSTVGTVAVGAGYMIEDSKKRYREDSELSKQWQKAEKILFNERKIDEESFKSLPNKAIMYLTKHPKAKYWPTGEPINISNGYIYMPQTLYINENTGVEWEVIKPKRASLSEKVSEKINSLDEYNQVVNKKYGGPSNNTIEMELTPEEIKEYIRQGYVIEEIN